MQQFYIFVLCNYLEHSYSSTILNILQSNYKMYTYFYYIYFIYGFDKSAIHGKLFDHHYVFLVLCILLTKQTDLTYINKRGITAS